MTHIERKEGERVNAIVNVRIATLFLEPNLLAEVADEALYGMPVEIIEEIDESWVKIRTFYRYEGYVLKENLIIGNEQVSAWITTANSVVIQSFADVLAAPKIQSTTLISLTRGAFLQQIDEEGLPQEWSKVQLVSGETGYVRTEWVQDRIKVYTLNEELFRQQVVQTAFRYLGTPYRWGGKSPLGIDCSGLCSMAYMLNGAYIYRDANIVEGFPLREITQDAMKRGDLIFFPGHVAMYIGGQHYIHSSLGGNEVNINSLNPQDENYREDLATTITGIGSIF